MSFQIIRNDITKVKADAIVNTANPEPVFASGTDSAVYHAAGEALLLAERRKIGHIEPGEAAVTDAFALPAHFIIHTVGPSWIDGKHEEFLLLASCYRKSLLLARQLGCRSIAFPLISTGVYGFPKDKALSIALREISTFLEDSEMEVTLVVFDRQSFDLSASLVKAVSQYIDQNYVDERSSEEYCFGSLREEGLVRESARRRSLSRRKRKEELSGEGSVGNLLPSSKEASSHPQASSPAKASSPPEAFSSKKRSLQDVMSHVGENFQTCLLRLIDERGLTDAQVYKRANIDRKLFSKIRCNPSYTPGRKTAIALAIALELNLDETTDLLRRAGIALSPGSRFDLIIRYCLENGIYDIMTINALLFDYDQPQLGA